MSLKPESELSALAAGLREGTVHLTAYLDELEAWIGERDPELLALMPEPARFSRLRREAAELEARFPEASSRPALFGIPVGIKDIFHVDGLPTTGGSKLPPEELAGPEAESGRRLRAAGALILGKTVSTEFAYFGPGPTRNPHDPERTPGGSSSGSAAAVAAGFCPAALGTQTIGSVSRTASYCGVCGYKPTYERISRAGVIPLSPSLDHVGVFTTRVRGIEPVARALATEWVTASEEGRPVLGIPEGSYLEHASAEGLESFESARERLESAGYQVRAAEAFPDFAEIERRHGTIVAADATEVHADWYSRHSSLYHHQTVELIEKGLKVSPEDLEVAQAGREGLRRRLLSLMDDSRIDLWISPASQGVAPRGLDSTGNPVMNLPWTHSGLPTLALPAGTIDGLPMGLQLAARWGEDERLLAWGAEIEANL